MRWKSGVATGLIVLAVCMTAVTWLTIRVPADVQASLFKRICW